MNKKENTKVIQGDELVKHYEGGDLKEIFTTKGIMPKSELNREVTCFEDDNELTYAIEYCLKSTNELVKRSVHIQLKKNVSAGPVGAKF